jgi:activator of 2-hydroxyglutaryl-CoA dehydratase
VYFVGVDIGSTMTKIVVMDETDHICSRVIGPTGPEHRRLANRVLVEALDEAGLSVGEMPKASRLRMASCSTLL